MSKNQFSLFDVVSPERPLESYGQDREFIVTKKTGPNLTVKDFFSGKTITANANAFRNIRPGDAAEVSFAKTLY